MKHRPSDPRSLSAFDLRQILSEPEDLTLEFKLEYELSREAERGELAKDVLALLNTAGRDHDDFAYLVIGAADQRPACTTADKSVQKGYYKESRLLQIVNATCDQAVQELLVQEIEFDGILYAVIILPPSPHVHSFSKNVTVKKIKCGRRTRLRIALVKQSSTPPITR